MDILSTICSKYTRADCSYSQHMLFSYEIDRSRSLISLVDACDTNARRLSPIIVCLLVLVPSCCCFECNKKVRGSVTYSIHRNTDV
jgi:hypothetical protein